MENMRVTITAPEERDEALIGALTALWEASVRATHHFLCEEEIQAIKPYVPEALGHVPVLFTAETSEGPEAFLGAAGRRIEMLFARPPARGRGLGRLLVEAAEERCGVWEVTVNEQNPKAAGFYRHMGFSVYKRTDLDEEGRPYPLLYMRLAGGEKEMEGKE